ncbi:MAG: Grx4 family monothiol glutaredoxin [Zymomonas mobilis subsp. pomaceae]|uniref:Glutaredoxin n=1 Tax=Zymomonas mobilis subsp. pomaceae (strain ATCC 29192 / DSM 22645 / JCM 10191 / CCUG 17912 / NBRC 13757 / NCIMB 11200 / NRRL B-4491 / Barker I) TaxID=579138 RepID=F8EUB9_ZYMMT|nr:Grx4 family monothiol glutaredoxin [Zymomonas mobilis]AEI38140.1 glutaredoxin-like protein [Zymomonas mobilis subsp. pomaceae ATCC 29192]MDX5949507.1 Grx4 family monothiol glutaredoxin [Zymomonas mobilis subsp. pomaceae]GEB89250.1 glutaredoxin [Zymomonas mobilis subsp. pomaceae]
MTNAVMEQIKDVLAKSPVVLFMKGTPLFPQCGFSNQVVAILNDMGIEYDAVDVLQDPEIRQAVKVYSDWPTFPQLYVKGELVGGCDIVMEMYESGELADLFKKENIAQK